MALAPLKLATGVVLAVALVATVSVAQACTLERPVQSAPVAAKVQPIDEAFVPAGSGSSSRYRFNQTPSPVWRPGSSLP